VVSLQVGITSAPSLYLSFEDIQVTPGAWLEVSGRFNSGLNTNGRILIQVTGSADGLFGGLRIRPLLDETPAPTVDYFVSRYIPRLSLSPDTVELLTEKRADWRMALVLDQVENSKDTLTRLAYQIGGRYFEDFRGRGKIGIPDIVTSAGSIFTFDETQIVLGSAQFDQFKSDEIYTEFHVYYNRDASLGESASAYRGYVYCTPSATNIDEDLRGLCLGAQGIIGGQTRRFELLADCIGDRETAELSLKHHLRDKTFQGYEVWLSAFLNAIHLEPTDIVSVDLDLLPSQIQGASFEVVDRAVDWNRVQTTFRLRQTPADPAPAVVETRTLIAADDLEPAVWTRDTPVTDEFVLPDYGRESLGTDEIDTET
jgi:hypothetical protein